MLLIDELLFKILFNLANEHSVLGRIMIVSTNWSSRVFAVIYVIGIVVLILNKSKKLIPFILAPTTAFLTVHIIRYIYLRPRPFVALEIESLIDHAANGSLPSMHAVSAFVIGMVVWYTHKRVGRYVLALATITGVSRVMVGVHYPLDIVVGGILAILISTVIFNIAKKHGDETTKTDTYVPLPFMKH